MSKQSSHTSKNSHTLPKYSLPRERDIELFCKLIKVFFPKNITVINPLEQYDYLLNSLKETEQELVFLVAKSLANLYQNHRVRHGKNTIELAEEDLLLALQITGEILNPLPFLSPKELFYFTVLEYHFKEKLFTRKEADLVFETKKTQSNLLLNTFLKKGLVEKKSGFKNKGYYYQVAIKNKELTPNEVFKKHPIKPGNNYQNQSIFEEITQEFADNENLEYQYIKDNFRF